MLLLYCPPPPSLTTILSNQDEKSYIIGIEKNTDKLNIGSESSVKSKSALNNEILSDISNCEVGILSENMNVDILPLEEDPNSQSVKSTNMNMNGNILEYIEQNQAVIGIITVIILSIILLAILIILTIPILRTSTTTDPEVQDFQSPYYLSQLSV